MTGEEDAGLNAAVNRAIEVNGMLDERVLRAIEDGKRMEEIYAALVELIERVIMCFTPAEREVVLKTTEHWLERLRNKLNSATPEPK